MEVTQEFVLGLVAQKDFDADFNDRLRSRAKQVCPYLLKIVSGEINADTYMRKNAIAMLGVVGDEDCVEALMDLTEDERPEFRANAIRSLGKMGIPGASTGLAKKLAQKDRSLTEGKLIVTALGQLHDKKAVSAIESFRKRVAKKHRDASHLERKLADIDDVMGKLKSI
jgi:HEAT repeat protein